MTQEEILEYNKRCAKFLGAEYESESLRYIFQKDLVDTEYTLRKSKRHHEEHMCFHSDWNWIIEVVDAIETRFPKYTLQWEYDDRNEFAKNGKYKAYWFTLYPKDEICSGLTDLRSKSREEAIVNAINQFLIWYYETN